MYIVNGFNPGVSVIVRIVPVIVRVWIVLKSQQQQLFSGLLSAGQSHCTIQAESYLSKLLT